MSTTQLREALAAKVKEALSLRDAARDRDMTPEEADQAKALLAEIADLRAKRDAAEARDRQFADVAALDADLNKPDPTRPRAGALLPRGPHDDRTGEAPPPTGSLGRRFTESEDFANWAKRARGVTPIGPSGKLIAESFYRGRGLMADVTDVAPENLRAVITDALTSGLVRPDRLPDYYRPDNAPFNIRALFPNMQTTSTSIEFVRETAFTNAAAAVTEAADDTGTDAAHGLKPTSDFAVEIATAPIGTIAHIMAATRQVLDDVPFMRGVIDTRLMDGLLAAEDAALISGTGSNGQIRGLENVSGVQVLDAAYWAANPPPADYLWIDKLRRARTLIRVVGRSRASAIILNPYDMDRAETIKDGTGQYLLRSGGPESGGVATLWRMPVVESEEVDEGTAWVGAFATQGMVVDRMQATIYMTDSHKDWFAHNLIALLAEERLGLVIFRPAGFATVDISEANA